LLAEAFFDNPAHVYICANPRTRLAHLEWLLGGDLRTQPDLRASFCLSEGAVVNAMGFWTRSDAPKASLLSQIRAGLLAAPLKLGFEGVRRLGEVTRSIDQHLDRALGDAPYWYLNNMVVRDKLRGSGMGTRLLEEQLHVVGKADPDRRLALSTQRPENVTFYGRLGFQVALDEEIGRGPEAFRSWIMVRSPAAQQGAQHPALGV
jgi:GNAT superfamily N-acetyltransferase